VIVWLTAGPGMILKRTRKDAQKRPLLKENTSISDIRELLKFRKPFYERAADMQIDTSRIDIQTVAEQILTKLREYEDSHFKE
jgi:shikimate kinase